MEDVVDQVMVSYRADAIWQIQSREEVRLKIARYLATLSSAGQKDADALTAYGLAYLRGLKGPDSRYTGC